MGDGSLSQEEIDALLQGGNAPAPDADRATALSGSIESGLRDRAPVLGVLLGRAATLVPARPLKMTLEGLRGLYDSPTVALALGAPRPAGNGTFQALILAGIDNATVLSSLMMGGEPVKKSELNEAEISTLGDFACLVFGDLVRSLAGAGPAGAASVTVLPDSSHLSLKEGLYLAVPLELSFEGADGPLGLHLVLDEAALSPGRLEPADSAPDVPDIGDQAAPPGAPEPARFFGQDEVSSPLERIHAKITAYILERGIRRSWRARKHAGAIYDELLSEDEKHCSSGQEQGLAPKEKRARALDFLTPIIKEKLKSAGALKSGVLNLGVNTPILNRVPFLLSVRFAEETLCFSDLDTGKAGAPGLETHIGETGELLLADRTIARVRLEKGRGQDMYLEVVEPFFLDETAILNLILSLPVALHMEAGRITVPAQEAASLRHGSVIELDRLAGEPLDLAVSGGDIVIARGEAVIINENMGIRITDICPVPVRAVGPRQGQTPSPVPTVTLRVIIGAVVLTVQDLMGLGEGSVIECDSLAGEPAKVLYQGGEHLQGEIVVIDENFGVRITEPPAPLSGTGRSAMAGVPLEQGEDTTVPADGTTPDRPLTDPMPREYLDLVEAEMKRRAEGGFSSAAREEILSTIAEGPSKVLKPFTRLNGADPEGAAALLVVLGEDAAAKLLALLDEDAMTALSRAVTRAGDVYPSRAGELLPRFRAMIEVDRALPRGDVAYLRAVLEKALGTERAEDVLDRLTSSQVPRPFDWLEITDPEAVLRFIQGEHPQTIALVLSHLGTHRAAALLSGLSPQARFDVSRRIACMDTVSATALAEVERLMKKKLRASAGLSSLYTGGIDALVELLNNIDRGTEKTIIEAFEEYDIELAEEIKKRLFVFEDILLLDDRSIQKVLREVDSQDLAKALKGVDTEVQGKVFRNMSKRASALLREDMDYMGPIRLADVEESQMKIVNIIRKLEESGDIIVGRAGEEELLV